MLCHTYPLKVFTNWSISVGLRQHLHWDCPCRGGGGDWPVHLLPGEQVQQDHGELCQDDPASGPGGDHFLQFIKLTNMAQVVRDGAQKEIEASELVVGDIVQIRGGDKTPADIRMLECHSIKVIACLLMKVL